MNVATGRPEVKELLVRLSRLKRELDHRRVQMKGPHLTLRELQQDLAAWQQTNFPDAKPTQAVMGLAEELGEAWETLLQLATFGRLSQAVGKVCHAALKLEQGIRGTNEELRAKLRDALGDLLFFLLNTCTLYGFDVEEIARETWATVSKRDWRENPIDGVG